jgi:TrmH family RNA methyltransferase
VVVVFKIPGTDSREVKLPSNPLILVLEAIEKPGNLGAILRSADCAGADAVLVTDPKVDLYSPGVVRASRGTLFSLPALELGAVEALDWLRAQGIRILAATPQAQALYTELDLTGPVCLALGTEDRGLSDFWLQAADLPVRIPMRGQVNSLNVSASAAILLFEAVRQRCSHG